MKRLLITAVLLSGLARPLYAQYDTGWRWLIGPTWVYYGRETQSAGGYAQYVLIDYVYSGGKWQNNYGTCGYAPWGRGGWMIITCFAWNGNVCVESMHEDPNKYKEACLARRYYETGLLLDFLNEVFPDGNANEDIVKDVVGAFDPEGRLREPYGNPDGATDTADPVFASNGEYRLSVTDLSIPGRGLPVKIVRTYGSRRQCNSRFGYGWDINYNMKVRRLEALPSQPRAIMLLNGRNYHRSYLQDSGDPHLHVRGEDLNNYLYDTDGQVTLVEKDGTEYAFDANGNLSTITDKNGNRISFIYNAGGLMPVLSHAKFFQTITFGGPPNKFGMVAKSYQLQTIIDDLGRPINLYYSTNGLLTDVNDFAGRNWHYSYDPAKNDLLSVRDPNGLTTVYTYDNAHNLLTVRDPNGQVYLANEYNRVADTVVEQTYGYGTYALDYNTVAQETVTTDREGYQTKMVYSDDQQVLRETVHTADPNAEPNSFTTQHFYDPNSRERTRTIFPNGTCVDYRYADQARLIGVYRKTEPDDPNSAADPNVIATTFTYDATHVHDVNSITDPMGNTTYFEFDPNGNVIQITYPAVPVYGYAQPQTPIVHYTYNGHGQVDTMTSADGIVAKYLYYSDTNPSDPNCGKLWKTIVDYNAVEGLNITTEYAYDTYGNIRETKDPNGGVSEFTYNQLNLLTRTVSPLGHVTLFTYNPNKKVTRIEREIPGPNQVTSFTYDLLDHLKTSTNPLGYVTHYGYTKSEEPNIVTDAENHSTVSVFNERGLLTQVFDANDDPTTYTYTANGDANDVQDAKNNKTRYEYDKFGRLIRTTYADDSNEVFTYDKNSNVISRTKRNGDVINYEYDGLNRLRVKSRPGEPNIVYTYDIAGRVYDVNNAGAITKYYYDRIGRLVDVNDPANRLVSYEYDSRGLRMKLIYPDNSFITYEYDAESKLRRICNDSNGVLAEYSYDDLSRRTLLTLGNDANVVYEYDLANRLTKLTNHLADPNTLAFAYDNYDHVGNRLSLKIGDANEQVYAYDPVYRLTYVDYNDGNDMSFYYDALGNRWRTINGGTVNYQTNNLNQYTSVAGTSYTYDDNGNLAFDGQFRYYYDCESRLTDINDVNDAPVASYAYDYLGRRISRTIYGAPNTTIKYAYDGDRIIAEYDGSGTLLRKFIYGPGIDEPICLVEVAENNAVYYYHFDGLGSVVALSDVNSVLVERYTYDVFGRPTIRDANGTELAASAFANPYRFTGRAYDAETGLYYYRARYYDYATARFLQPDATGYTGGLNLYSYCGNNPIVFVDPDGNLHFLVTGAIGAAAGFITNAGLTLYRGGSVTDALKAGAVGAVSGGVSGLLAPFIGLPAAGGIGGFVSSALGQYVQGASPGEIFTTPAGLGRLFVGTASGIGGGIVGARLGGLPLWGPAVTEIESTFMTKLAVGTFAGLASQLGNAVVTFTQAAVDLFNHLVGRWEKECEQVP
jgi:RHS repeat-associated protein